MKIGTADASDWDTFLVLYALAAFGLAYILGHSLITRGAREWVYDFHFGDSGLYPLRWLALLVECPACSGWWIGLAAGYHFQGIPLAIFAALFTTSTNYLLGRATGLIARPGEH